MVRFPLAFETPLRTGNLRDPNGPQTTFAGESFIDEMATAANADPVEFRLRLLRGSTQDRQRRSCGPVQSPWSRRRPRPTVGIPDRHRNRRAAAAFSPGGASLTPTVAGRLSRRSPKWKWIARAGRVWVKRMVCGHDCGLVINPDGLRSTIQGNLLHGLSRALYEEVQFDTEKVKSVDWLTHPTLRHEDAPERIDIVLRERRSRTRPRLICLPTEPVNLPSGPSPRQSRTRSTTRPAFASVALPSEPSAYAPPSRLPASRCGQERSFSEDAGLHVGLCCVLRSCPFA